MTEYCVGRWWDLNQTWYTETPDFTLCFQNTMFTIFPSMVFSIILLIGICQSALMSNRIPLRWTWLNISKMVLCFCLFIISIIKFGLNLHEVSEDEVIGKSSVLASAVQSATYIIVLYAMYRYRMSGVTTSTALCLFWLWFSLCGIVMHRSSILTYYGWSLALHISKSEFILDMLYYPIVYIELLLSVFADRRDYNLLEKGSPMEEESFFSFLSFFWFTKIIYRSTKKKLTVDDFTPLSGLLKSNFLWKKFSKTYKFQSGELPSKKKSLAWALVKALWPWVTWAFVLEISFALFLALQPILLDLMIRFITHDSYVWRGYLYCLAIFGTNVLSHLIYNNFVFYLINFGAQVKSALIGAIYRKSLQMSCSTRRNYTSGELMNFISVDVERIVRFTMFSTALVVSPLKICISLALLWQYLGASCLAGIGVVAVMIPVNFCISAVAQKYSVKQMEAKDSRLKYMNEILNGMKVLKLYAWEQPFMEKVSQARTTELKLIRFMQLLFVFSGFIFSLAPFLIAALSFITYLLVNPEHVLTPSKAFVSVNLMNILKYALFEMPDTISEWIQTNVSLGRLRKFFTSEEYNANMVGSGSDIDEVVTVTNGTFSWDKDGESILKDINLRIKKGDFIAVIGTVGCGKSSLLSALLGDMYKTSGSVDVTGNIAYVPQQAWILNRTVKENILLVRPMKENVYNKILDSCCLRPDLTILPGYDETEIGEKGVNISGGQKQRISLARAVFQDADIYLLDDPLSAVDAHVRKSLVKDVLGNSGLLKKKTRILVTHDVSFLSSVDLIISMKDGKIDEIGKYNELMKCNGSFAEFIREHANQNAENEHIGDTKVSTPEFHTSKISFERSASRDSAFSRQQSISEVNVLKDIGNLIEEEKMEEGEVKHGVYLNYIRHFSFLYLTLAVIGFAGYVACELGSNVWLSIWSNDDVSMNSTSMINGTTTRTTRIAVYGAIGAAEALCIVFGTIFFILGSLRASKLYHKQMLDSVLKSPMVFFDTTPLGRIMNRFGSDMDVVDVEIIFQLEAFVYYVFGSLSTFIIIGINAPLFLAAVIPLMVVYYFVQRLYLHASRQITRLESTSRSPIYSHFLETIQGVSSIKAYNISNQFIQKMEKDLDVHISCSFHVGACNRWLSFWLDMVGSIIVLIAALLAIQNREALAASVVGLIITYALTVTECLLWQVRTNTELENKSISIERLEEYCNLPSEAPWYRPHCDPQYSWPENGGILFESYSTRYREGLDLVLNEINLNINPTEKIGIVGRTGAGKSSVTLALFRIIESVEGRILIDDVDISRIGLHSLRSKLTIIPQDPVLFTGSVRMNMDPNDQYTDDEIWASLEQANLKNFISGLDDGLDYEIAEGGENLSVGQRQLICLARALLKRTKILVLDEATAAVDMETDMLIQNSIRTEFKENTVITIAHRLNTIIDYDKVIVMDQGHIVEFGKPSTLMQSSESKFHKMAKDAGLL